MENMQAMQPMTFYTIAVSLALGCNVVLCGYNHNETKPEHIKANGYLVQKWKLWFDLNDINGDGMLSLDDTKLFELIKNLQMPINSSSKFDNDMIIQSETEISKNDFINILKQTYEFDKAAFKEFIYNLELEWSTAKDVNGDNIISKDEFLIEDMLSARRNDKVNNEKFFLSFPEINGSVPLEVMVTSFVRFLTEDDKIKPDSIKSFLDSIVKI